MMQELLDYLDFRDELEANSYWYFKTEGNWNEDETRFINVFDKEQE